MIYPITPVSKPRQTRADKWKQRDCVMKYRAFADECRLRNVQVGEQVSLTFYIPMPASWSKKKREIMLSTPHQQKPDIDNLVKAVLDAVHKDDSHVWNIQAKKVWYEHGQIEVV